MLKKSIDLLEAAFVYAVVAMAGMALILLAIEYLPD
jgi:hypothetical protein